MRKGERRKQEILDTAQRLFFDRGYENTAIQDILDEMGLSKGGFYHHFGSKLELLESICKRRAEEVCARGIRAAQEAGDHPVAKLNALFREGGFFGEEALRYVSLVLSTAYGGELSQLRDCNRAVTLTTFEPLLQEILLDGMEREVFYVRRPENLARLIILLALDVTDELGFMIAGWKNTGPAAPDDRPPGYLPGGGEKMLNAPTAPSTWWTCAGGGDAAGPAAGRAMPLIIIRRRKFDMGTGFIWSEHLRDIVVTGLLSMVPTFEGRYALTIGMGLRACPCSSPISWPSCVPPCPASLSSG